jgi:hypothetical protein
MRTSAGVTHSPPAALLLMGRSSRAMDNPLTRRNNTAIFGLIFAAANS